MEPILNTFSIAGELRGNAAGFTTKALLVSPFVPVKYSIPTLPCTTSLFGDAWLVPNWKHLFWSWGVNFRPRHSFMILRCFILCLALNPDRAPLLLVHPAVTRRNAWHLRTDHAAVQNDTETNVRDPSQSDASEYPVYLLVMGHGEKKRRRAV